MQFKDYYATLGVEPSAGEAEIKTAYRRLARKYHPDVSQEPGAEERFKAVNEAYEALRDPNKRAAYDQLRAQGYRPGDEFHAPPNFGGGHGFNFEEVFGNASGGISAISLRAYLLEPVPVVVMQVQGGATNRNTVIRVPS